EPGLRFLVEAHRTAGDSDGFLARISVPSAKVEPKRTLEVEGARLGPEPQAFGRFLHVPHEGGAVIHVESSPSVVIDGAEVHAAHRAPLFDLATAPTRSGNDLSLDSGLRVDSTGLFTVRYH